MAALLDTDGRMYGGRRAGRLSPQLGMPNVSRAKQPNAKQKHSREPAAKSLALIRAKTPWRSNGGAYRSQTGLGAQRKVACALPATDAGQQRQEEVGELELLAGGALALWAGLLWMVPLPVPLLPGKQAGTGAAGMPNQACCELDVREW